MNNYYAIHEDDIKVIIALLKGGKWAANYYHTTAEDLVDSLTETMKRMNSNELNPKSI